ncbi:MAG: HTH domain-containing protein [Chitinophagaceae bacterium]|nr:HTH domain-containing protein [Chitinophagaceae bacterium]
MPRTFIKRFQRIDKLIQSKTTGNASELAAKLEVSARTAKDFIAVMRELGAPIYFDKYKNSYCYKDTGSFNISFTCVQ